MKNKTTLLKLLFPFSLLLLGLFSFAQYGFYNRSGISYFNENNDTVNYPIDTIDYPIDTIYFPIDTIDYPIDTIYFPVDTIDYPIDTIYFPIDTIDYPIDTIHFPIDTIDYPIDTIHFPIDTIDYPIDTIYFPIDTIDYPIDTIYFPIDTIDYPIDTIYFPIDTIDYPIDTIHFPIDTIDYPIDTIYFPVDTIESGNPGTSERDILEIGTSEVEKLINIYPNPVKDIIYLKIDDTIKVKMIYISDSSGKIVLSKNYNSDCQIDVGFLPSGFYLMVVHSDYWVINKKILIE